MRPWCPKDIGHDVLYGKTKDDATYRTEKRIGIGDEAMVSYRAKQKMTPWYPIGQIGHGVL